MPRKNPFSVPEGTATDPSAPGVDPASVETGPFGSCVVANAVCPAWCCKKGRNWVLHHHNVDEYVGGPTTTGCDTYAWGPVHGGVPNLAWQLRNRGLLPWAQLQPAVRGKFNHWSPVARQLWESELDAHPEALVRAWIWHYFDDNLLSFFGDTSTLDPVPCASPVWEHVRALRRDLSGECARRTLLISRGLWPR